MSRCHLWQADLGAVLIRSQLHARIKNFCAVPSSRIPSPLLRSNDEVTALFVCNSSPGCNDDVSLVPHREAGPRRRACLCPPHACGLNLTPPDLVTCAPLPACPEQFSTSVPAMKHAQPTGKPRRDNLQARARLASTLAHNPWIALASPHSRGCASGRRARRYPSGYPGASHSVVCAAGGSPAPAQVARCPLPARLRRSSRVNTA